MTTTATAHANCDTCGFQSMLPALTATDLRTGEPGVFRYVKCGQCGLVQMSPKPTSEQFTTAYAEWLWQDEIARGRTQPSRVSHALKQLADHGIRPGELLDVGCGPGTMLMGAVAAGWRARGIESSPAQVRHCLDQGLDAALVHDFPTYVDTLRYDAVVFNHVLEHVPSPRAYLAKALSLLKPDGLVLIAVPNYGSLSRRLFGKYWVHLDAPRHLYQFTPRTLSLTVAKAGGFVLDQTVGDREDNATGARESLRRCLSYGLLNRSARATRAGMPADAALGMSLSRRIFRAYGEVMAALSEQMGLADTLIILARSNEAALP